MIVEVPELKPGRGYVYALTVPPGETGAARVTDFSNAEGEVRYLPSLVGELLGGTLRVGPRNIDLQLAFNTLGPSTVEYDGLSFGYELSHEGLVVSSQQWPDPNVRYLRSDQEWLLTTRLSVGPDREYLLLVWAEDHQERFESSWSLLTPRPAQPFPSWAWDGDIWQAPEPFPSTEPSTGFFWGWDEDTLSWVETEL